MEYIDDRVFDRVDFALEGFVPGEYSGCRFVNCHFGGVNLAGVVFEDCECVDCDLSMANLSGTALRNVRFKGCKMMGCRFDLCHSFGFEVAFEGCRLHHASFYQRSMKKTPFRDCELHEVDFTEADLSQALFAGCDLMGALFDRTRLDKADLRTAIHYDLDPDNNFIRGAQFALPDVLALLRKHGIVVVDV